MVRTFKIKQYEKYNQKVVEQTRGGDINLFHRCSRCRYSNFVGLVKHHNIMLTVPESYYKTFFVEGYILAGFENIEPCEDLDTYVYQGTLVVRIPFNLN